jgi:hypothetical protein
VRAYLYGLPLPSPRAGLASVIAMGGTGRLSRMAARFGGIGPTESFDLDALAQDAARSIAHLDLMVGRP